MTDRPTVLYVCTDHDRIAGSSASLFDLLAALDGQITPIVLLHSDGPVADRLRRLGIAIVISPFFYLWSRPRKLRHLLRHPLHATLLHFLRDNRRCARRVARQLAGTRIDIVHSNTTITTVGHTLAHRLKARHVWHVREYLDLDFQLKVYGGRPRLRRLLNRADARICISDAVRRHWRLRPERTLTVWDAVRAGDNTPSTPEARLRQVLFCAVNVTPLKGADMAVELFALSGLAHEGYTLVLAGHCTPDYQARLSALAASRQADGVLRFVGYQADTTPLFRQSSAFLMTSPCEALGRVTVQAMLLQCPVVGRRSGATAELIADGTTGFLFDTAAEGAAALRRAVADSSPALVHNALRFATVHFGPDTYRQQILPLYLQLAQSR